MTEPPSPLRMLLSRHTRRREFIELLLGGVAAWPMADVLPPASVVAVLVNPRSPESEPQTKDIELVARSVGQQIRVLNASSDRDIDAVFATLVEARDAGLLVTNDALFSSSRDQIIALAASRAIPTIYDRRAYADAGELMSYGTHYLDGHRRLGSYTAKNSQRGKACGFARGTIDQIRVRPQR